jgi:membrane protease YdiL (CAAX protease family)
VIVILGAFGMFVLGSIAAVLSQEFATPISNAGLLDLVAYEVVLLAVIGTFLALRGWRWPDLGMAPTLKDTGIGALLAAASHVGFLAALMIYGRFLSYSSNEVPIDTGLQPATVVLLSLVNGFFEELFVCGYLINAVKKRRSVVFAINASVALRLAYHLYQGPIAVPSILPMGLIFGYWFAKTGRLWPLVVAHALMDFWALWPYIA